MKDLKTVNAICGAKTRSGQPCSKFPIRGKNRCRLHGGLSTGPRTLEGRARIAAANSKHGRYVGWRAYRAKEEYYFGEIRRIMREAKDAGSIQKSCRGSLGNCKTAKPHNPNSGEKKILPEHLCEARLSSWKSLS